MTHPFPAQMLVTASAAIIFLLGAAHLAFTFSGTRLHPREPELVARMEATPPVISRQTNMWKAWIGFNASHSLGAMLFGAVFAYLALVQPALLFGTYFLGLTGLLTLAGYLALARRYWFNRPLQGIGLALLLYVAAFALALLQK